MIKQLRKFDNFLSDELLDELQVFSYNSLRTPVPSLGRTNLCWGEAIIKQSTPVIVKDILPEDKLYAKVKNEIESRCGWEVDKLMIYHWTKLSYIPWHNDSHTNAGLTIYLNDFWDDDWGGYFMYQTDKDIKAIKPELNLGVLQEGNIRHSVSTINLDADIRVTLQAFFNNKI